MSPAAMRFGNEAGTGGVEVLALGALVFVAGLLIVANAWGVVDAKLAALATAREATRAYVEAPSDADAVAEAQRAASAAITGHGRRIDRMTLRPLGPLAFHRCARVTYEVTYRVPAVVVPWIGGFADGVTVRARHSEVVDPYRAGVPLAPGHEEAECA